MDGDDEQESPDVSGLLKILGFITGSVVCYYILWFLFGK